MGLVTQSLSSKAQFRCLYAGQPGDMQCSLLDLGDYKILLDCGWDFPFTEEAIAPLKEVVDQIDYALIGQASLNCTGALPFLCSANKHVKIFSSIPVYKMGQMFLYDSVVSAERNATARGGSSPTFSLADVDAAFDRMTVVRSLENFELDSTGIEISAHKSGVTVGSVSWSIKVQGQEILYAPDFNPQRERHLGGTQLEGHDHPLCLITAGDCFGREYLSRKARDQALVDTILGSLRKGGDVLIPSDVAGRSLELLQTLEQTWQRNKLPYGIAFMGDMCYNALEFAKSQLEWMSEPLMKAFDLTRQNPFVLKHVQVVSSPSDLVDVPSPRVVLTSSASLESGITKDVLAEFLANEKSLVLCVARSKEGTLAHSLLKGNPAEEKRKVSLDYLVHSTVVTKQGDVSKGGAAGTAGQQPLMDLTQLAPGATLAAMQEIAEDRDTDGAQTGFAALEEQEKEAAAGGEEDGGFPGEGREKPEGVVDDDAQELAGLFEEDDARAEMLRREAAVASTDSGNKVTPFVDHRRIAFDAYLTQCEEGDAERVSRKAVLEGVGVRVGENELLPENSVVRLPSKRMREDAEAAQPGWDEYGRVVNYAWLRDAAKKLAEPGEDFTRQRKVAFGRAPRHGQGTFGKLTGAEGGKDDKNAAVDGADGLARQEETTVTVTYARKEEDVAVRCSFRYIDYSGLVDRKSMSVILEKISPRLLVVFRGSMKDRTSLGEYASKTTASKALVCDDSGSSREFAFQREQFEAIMSDELADSIREVDLEDRHIARCRSRVHYPFAQGKPILQIPGEGADVEVGADRADFVGNYDPAGLREILRKAGYDARVEAGNLLCPGGIRVLRGDALGKVITVEGPISKDYYAIRKAVYSWFALI